MPLTQEEGTVGTITETTGRVPPCLSPVGRSGLAGVRGVRLEVRESSL